MKLIIVTEQEEDGSWIAEIEQQPGVMQYGRSPKQSILVALYTTACGACQREKGA